MVRMTSNDSRVWEQGAGTGEGRIIGRTNGRADVKQPNQWLSHKEKVEVAAVVTEGLAKFQLPQIKPKLLPLHGLMMKSYQRLHLPAISTKLGFVNLHTS